MVDVITWAGKSRERAELARVRRERWEAEEQRRRQLAEAYEAEKTAVAQLESNANAGWVLAENRRAFANARRLAFAGSPDVEDLYQWALTQAD